MDKKIKYLIVFLSIFVFVAFKLIFLTLHFGDSNVYFYMAKAVLQGQIPYRDFFLGDPPLLVLILAFLRIFFGNNLIFYQSLPVFFEALSAFILFLILEKEKSKFAFLAPLIYLFSFTILATCDYLTGAQLVIFFSLLGIFLWKKEMPFFSAVFWSLACLVKLYAAPAFLGFLIFVFLEKNKKSSVKFILGIVLAALLVMSPFLIASFYNVVNYTITHHFNRPAGLSKINVFNFLIFREWLLLILAIGGIIISKKKEFFYPLIFSLIFFLLFKDIYYAYFDVIFTYIVIFVILFLDWLWQKKKELFYSVLIVYFIFFFISLNYYQQTSFNEGRFTNANEISDYVKTLPVRYDIYGSYESAPVIALLSGRKLFNNYMDTSQQVFTTGILNLEKVSSEAAKSGVILIAKITDLPEYNIKDFGYDAYFSEKIFKDDCQRIKDFPETGNEQENHIVLYKCEEKTAN